MCGPRGPAMMSRAASASSDGERRCRLLCRPIETGIGEIVVRPIGPADADMARAFIDGLSATSRHHRFFTALKALSPGMLDRFIRTDHPDHMALVGIAHRHGQQSIVGEARYARSRDGASADIALAVADAWQRRGIGTGLLDMLERMAAATGVTRLTGESLAVNKTFLSFARAFGFGARPDDVDRSVLRIEKQIGACTVIVLGGHRRDAGG